MKRRLILLAIVPLVALFVWAREAASWRPKTIGEAEFYARLAPPPKVVDFATDVLTANEAQLKQRMSERGWLLLAMSPNAKRVFAQTKDHCTAAIFSVEPDINKLHRVTDGNQMDCYPRTNAFWSPDGRVVWCSFGKEQKVRVYNANFGNFIWNEAIDTNDVLSSPDGRLVLVATKSGRYLEIYEALTGWQTKFYQPQKPFKSAHFSRDSSYVLIENANGQFQQLRLR